MLERLDGVVARLEELNRQLSDPAVAGDARRMRELSREHARVLPVVDAYERWKSARDQLAEARELLADPEMAEVARDEVNQLEELLESRHQELRLLLLPPDPYEGRSILLEVRAGTGGDEAALFAADLFRMYHRYCDTKGFRVEVLSASPVTVGGAGGRSASGYREIICQIGGAGAYTRLKHESGVHRVQRIPLTETQGRVHTSAATVAIMPEPEEVEIHIEDKDLRIDVFRASGPGGQSVNTTDSAVRLTHIPSGLVVICQDEKSQLKNKNKAMKVLATRLFDLQEAERAAKEAAERKAQVGTGDRSERIRTYNYPQNRVTDHRINLTVYHLDAVVEGDLDQLVDPLNAAFQAKALEAEGL